ncbi:MAG: tRNA (adenosine(37)-N6)-threonylcarbamoyltransferase complex transferase subunit TsaD [Verrucomicrobiaceae bacterium]|nr:tRNA (adenosine(37)-N6)-threonylcarbamoyltransferase complex transferase subunit TsaD [Verrucomicrobiaceae bacterium]
MILALESSCDETAAAVLDPPRALLSSEVASQVSKHRPFGGVVPELASRNHLLSLRPVIESALQGAGVCLKQMEAFAATSGPGLASSLLMGNTAAKALAATCAKPFISVNHMEGHLLSPFLDAPLKPHVALIVSGGHTLLIKVKEFGNYEKLGSSRDDAAGEAFDKVGKMLGLPYPGGPEVEKCAKEGNSERFPFPRSMLGSGDFHFSFSGLKTSVLYTLQKIGTPDQQTLADLCASFQAAVIEVLVTKALSAAEHCGMETLALSGGVACNKSLRENLHEECGRNGIGLCAVTPEHSTDNAAMIARAAAEKLARGQFTALSEDIDPNLSLAP